MRRNTCQVTNPSRAAIVLSIRDELVIQLKLDFGFTIVTEHSETRIEQPFRLAAVDGQTYSIDPENPTRADDLLKLHYTKVNGDCFEDGSLEMRFATGAVMEVAPSDTYEAWTLTRKNGEMVVSSPGGELTIFGPRT